MKSTSKRNFGGETKRRAEKMACSERGGGKTLGKVKQSLFEPTAQRAAQTETAYSNGDVTSP